MKLRQNIVQFEKSTYDTIRKCTECAERKKESMFRDGAFILKVKKKKKIKDYFCSASLLKLFPSLKIGPTCPPKSFEISARLGHGRSCSRKSTDKSHDPKVQSNSIKTRTVPVIS